MAFLQNQKHLGVRFSDNSSLASMICLIYNFGAGTKLSSYCFVSLLATVFVVVVVVVVFCFFKERSYNAQNLSQINLFQRIMRG